MERASSSSPPPTKFRPNNKRPDSLKLELLTIPEDNGIFNFDQSLANVGFENLSYSVLEGIFKRRTKFLLDNVSGEFCAGELTAIMGPSGAGKTTLMKVLAGYINNKRVKGKLLLNNELREENSFRKQSCFIMQDDNLQPLLTVHEAMTVAASLKIAPLNTQKDKQLRVKEILNSLNLWNCRKTKTGVLSGGQKKRLSIALELLKNPQIMFFDEPTSGLDSLSSKQCIMLLKQIAASGRTVICTIHQPSAIIFEMFDHLYALANGKCIYQGSIKGLLPYLEETNLKCPTYHNLADYLIEVASGEYGDYISLLVNKSENGQSQEWRKNQRNSLQFQSIEHIDKLMQNGQITPVSAPSILFKSSSKGKNIKNDSNNFYHGHYATSFWHQIGVLLKRTFLLITRDKTLTFTRICTHLSIALFIGVLYFGIGTDASNVLNNSNFMFFSVMFLMLTAFNSVLTTFPANLPIIAIEHFNKWYCLPSYFFAITLADIPIQLVATLLYALVTYFMTMQPVEPFRIVYFLLMCILISFVSQSFGFFIGTIMDIKNGVIFGPFFLLPFVIFSGFFVQLNSSHPWFQWIFHISFLKYGYEGLMLSVFGYNRERLPCNRADYCHFVSPQKFLEQMDMEYSEYSIAVAFMIGLMTAIRIVSYFALCIKIDRRS